MSECAIGKGADCMGDCFSCCVHRVMAERDRLCEQVATLEGERAAWQYEANRLRAALEPVADWLVAMLGAHLNDQQGFLPDEAVIFNTNDVKLTAGQARALVAVCGLAEALKGAEEKG